MIVQRLDDGHRLPVSDAIEPYAHELEPLRRNRDARQSRILNVNGRRVQHTAGVAPASAGSHPGTDRGVDGEFAAVCLSLRRERVIVRERIEAYEAARHATAGRYIAGTNLLVEYNAFFRS